jgi:hypothetical protein
LPAVYNEPAVYIRQYKQDHASQNKWNEYFVKQIDEKDEWKHKRAGFVVTHPRIGERFRGGIRMTLLTFDKQVLLVHKASLGVILS